MTSGSASWSDIRASGQSRVQNGHQYNNNYNNYYDNSQTRSLSASEEKNAGEDLLKAVREGQRRRVEVKLRNRPDLIDYADADGLTALQYASRNGHEDIVRMLLESGADVNARSLKSGTALCLAALNAWTSIVELLIEWRADVRLGGTTVGYPMHTACISGDISVVQLLLTAKAAPDITSVVSCEDLESLKLLQIPWNKDQSRYRERFYKCRPLYVAAYFGYTSIVNLLILHGADVNARSGLCLTHGLGSFHVLRCTALMVVARWGHLDTAEVFLRAGADTDLQDSHGWTALMHAAASGSEDCVAVLLEYGAQIDMQDDFGKTAVMLAVKRGHLSTLRELTKAGASIDIKASDGSTVLDIARRIKNAECERFLAIIAQKRQTGPCLRCS